MSKAQADVPKVPRIDEPMVHRDRMPMSPREFLRQTIMGQQNPKNSLLTFRNKQKFNKKGKF